MPAGKKTFQLLTQAAGRAGRGEDAGSVVIQTYMPDHYSIQAAASQDYERFYREEMSYRTMLRYPPVLRMLAIAAASPKEEELRSAAAVMGQTAEKYSAVPGGRPAEIIGPVDAPIYKVNDIYRKILYIKHENYDILLKIREQIEKLELPVLLGFDMQ